MISNTTRAAAGFAAAATILSIAAASPAAAAPKDSFQSRMSGASAKAQWIEYDYNNDLGAPGNVHVGFLEAYKGSWGSDVWGVIEDWQCDEGEVPGGGGGHGEEPAPDEEEKEGFCDNVGTRFLSSAWDRSTQQPLTTFTVDLRAGTARLVGQLEVSNGGHGDGTVLGSPPVDMTWTGVGTAYRATRTENFVDGDATYRMRVRAEGYSNANISGAIGRMGFTDDADDTSSGSFESFREMSRERIG